MPILRFRVVKMLMLFRFSGLPVNVVYNVSKTSLQLLCYMFCKCHCICIKLPSVRHYINSRHVIFFSFGPNHLSLELLASSIPISLVSNGLGWRLIWVLLWQIKQNGSQVMA